jgi:hypothetical protein
MKSPDTFTFDAARHEYRIAGAVVPSVTQILRDVLPGWAGTEYDMALGTCCHARFAMLARGEEFEPDPQFDGYVAAWRKWALECKVRVMHVEARVASVRLQFAGTLDLVAEVSGVVSVCDYKATLTPATEHQVAAYALALLESRGLVVNYGAGVELRADGTYKMQTWPLKRAKEEWKSILTVYGLRRKCGVKENHERN